MITKRKMLAAAAAEEFELNASTIPDYLRVRAEFYRSQARDTRKKHQDRVMLAAYGDLLAYEADQLQGLLIKSGELQLEVVGETSSLYPPKPSEEMQP
jgi:hypothetical protein